MKAIREEGKGDTFKGSGQKTKVKDDDMREMAGKEEERRNERTTGTKMEDRGRMNNRANWRQIRRKRGETGGQR